MVKYDYIRRAYDALLTPAGYEQITSMSGIVRLPNIPDGCVGCLLQAEDKDIRWRADGTNPSGSIGMVLHAGQEFWCNMRLRELRFIETAASAKLNIHYFTSD